VKACNLNYEEVLILWNQEPSTMKNSKWLIALLSFVIASCEDSCKEKKPLWSGEGLYGIQYRIQCASTVPSCDRKTAIEISTLIPNVGTDTLYICCKDVPGFLDSARVYHSMFNELPAVIDRTDREGHLKARVTEYENWNLGLRYVGEADGTRDTLRFRLFSLNNPLIIIFFKDPAQIGYFISQVDSVFKPCCLY
jgi:hypothetical protein